MTLLILGLILFLAPHSVRIVADDWRSAQVARIGLPAWKGLYSVVSIVGLALIVWGYGMARTAPIEVWNPPVFTRHLASLFTLAAFVLLVAAYVPRNRIRAAIGHPMVAGVKLWAFAHLLANGTVADLLLFGSFLVWAIFDFRAARRRDRAAAGGDAWRRFRRRVAEPGRRCRRGPGRHRCLGAVRLPVARLAVRGSAIRVRPMSD